MKHQSISKWLSQLGLPQYCLALEQEYDGVEVNVSINAHKWGGGGHHLGKLQTPMWEPGASTSSQETLRVDCNYPAYIHPQCIGAFSTGTREGGKDESWISILSGY